MLKSIIVCHHDLIITRNTSFMAYYKTHNAEGHHHGPDIMLYCHIES